MNDEPEIRELSDNVNHPTTTSDVEELAAIAAKNFDAVNDRFEKIDRELAAVRSSQHAILDVVRSIDRQLHEWNTIPARVDPLERTVFRR